MPRQVYVLLIIGVCGICTASLMAQEVSPEKVNEVANAQMLLASLTFPANQPMAFVQRQRNPLLRNISEQQGILSKDDAGLHMQVITPREERRTIHQGKVSLSRQRMDRRTHTLRTVTRASQLQIDNPTHLVLLVLEALLTGDDAFVQSHFNIALITAGRTWQLELKPKQPELREQLSRIQLSGYDSHLRTFRSEHGDIAEANRWMEVVIDNPACCSSRNSP